MITHSKTFQNKLTPMMRLLRYAFLLCLIIPLFTSCQSQRTIVNGLDEREANEILVFLASRGINAEKAASKEVGGGGSKEVKWDIVVKDEEANQAMAVLNQNGLPRRSSQNLLNIFSNVGLVPSAMEQQIRYQAGLAEQIASTIRKIDGILDAEVQISFPKEDPLNPEKKTGKITASVYVKHNGVLDDPNSYLITKIKRLVEASVTGLTFDNVTVIADRARFNELPNNILAVPEEKSFLNVWGLIIGKESLTTFRIIFFSFLIATVLLLLSVIWLIWKIFPVLEAHGGVKELFHLEPLKTEKNGHVENNEEKESEETEEQENQEKDESDQASKDFDETE